MSVFVCFLRCGVAYPNANRTLPYFLDQRTAASSRLRLERLKKRALAFMIRFCLDVYVCIRRLDSITGIRVRLTLTQIAPSHVRLGQRRNCLFFGLDDARNECSLFGGGAGQRPLNHVCCHQVNHDVVANLGLTLISGLTLE